MLLSSLRVKQARLIIIVALLSCLTIASDCQNLERLHRFAEAGIAAERNWYKAASLGDQQAAMQLTELATATKQLHWLNLLVDLQFAEAQFQLAKLTTNKALRSLLLQKAAQQDHLGALFYIGQNSSSPTSKINAYTRAAQLAHRPSQYALYQWHWLHGDYELAVPWLTLLAEQDADSALVLAMHLWRQDSVEEAKQWFASSAEMGNRASQEYLKIIAQYWQKPPKISKVSTGPLNSDCQMQLQFVATSLESMAQALKFKQEFAQDKRLQSLPICVNAVAWFDADTVPCQHGAVNQQRITCDIKRLDKTFKPGDFSHLVVFARHGKANVNNGVMYLDLADQYSVFVHELAHFAGFVDEYPLSEALAERICRLDANHPNIIVEKIKAEPKQEHKQTLTTASDSDGQNTVTPASAIAEINTVLQAGILPRYKARTCNNHEYQAYKTEKRMTFLEFHDHDVIPESYLEKWRERLIQRRDLVPASLNMAHALEDSGNFPRAELWRQHFVTYRQGPEAIPNRLQNLPQIKMLNNEPDAKDDSFWQIPDVFRR